MPSKQDKAIDLGKFLDNHPLNFLLFYGDYEVINTVYLDDGSPLVDLSVELFNQSPKQVVKFAQPPNKNSPASADNCHFYLNLEGKFVLDSALDGWEVKEEESTFYFLKKQAGELQPKSANGSTNKIVLNLKKFRADIQGGTRTPRAELTYGPLLKDQNNQPFQDEHGQYFSYGNTIFITNNRGGKKTLPLQVGFAAGNSVLNDGTATNSLELLIANKNWPSSNLSLSQDSEFVISFEMGDKAKEGAVATETQIKAIAINTSQSDKWDVQHVANLTEWTVKPKSEISRQLASNQSIKLNITNLVTSNSSGSGYLYVRYKNIPNYPDGQFVVPVEKTPLLYREAKVGIGINNPSAKLHVSGGNAIVTNGNVGIGTGTPDAKLHVQDGDVIVSGISSKVVMWQGGMFIPGMNTPVTRSARLHVKNGDAIVEDGKVGIGTDNPLAKLHVKDGNAIVMSGNVGIGTDNPLAKLHVKDGNAIVMSGNVGIGVEAPSDKLHIKGGDLRIDSGSIKSLETIAFYPNTDKSSNKDLIKVMKSDGNSTAMLVNHEGKVGIGTIDPKAHLHVVGDLVLGTNNANKKFIIHSRGDISDFLQIAPDKSNGDWEWDQGIILRRNGNVGIGTDSPEAKLDVHGDFYIKGKKPIEYKTYKRENSDSPTVETDYNYPEWIAIVAGFNCAAHDQIKGVRVLPVVNNNKWQISCDMNGTGDERFWEIAIIFIRSELVFRHSEPWR